MVSNKFLQDDGEDDEVICSEWAASGGLHLDQLKKLEVDFLNAIVSRSLSISDDVKIFSLTGPCFRTGEFL